MKHHTPSTSATLLTMLLSVAGLSALPALAEERAPQTSATATVAAAVTKPVRGLSPARISAIRGIGRSVLVAKKSGQEDLEDTAQLTSLRASVDALLSTDTQPALITVANEESSEQRRVRDKVTRLRETARGDARAVAVQLRNHSERIAARVHSQDEEGTRSAGMPIGEQRAHLFERWASKLDAALAADGGERLSKLNELHQQLKATDGRVSEVPLTRGTPTLQAMPAGFAPPKNTAQSSADGSAAKE